MSRYVEKPQENPARKPIHPAWRGVGCGLMIVIPAISYIAGNYFVDNANSFKWVVIPQDLVKTIFPDPFILVKLLYAAIFVAVLYLLLLVITVFINRYFGPSRYGPYDIPLNEVDRKKKL